MRKLFIFFLFVFFSFTVKAQQASTFYESALLLVQHGKLDAAEVTAKNSIKADKNYLPARLLLADILLEKGDPAAAEKELTVALNLDADHLVVVLPLAKTKALLSKHREVLDFLEAFPKLAAEQEYALLLSASQKALNYFTLAVTTLKTAIGLHGENSELLLGLAEVYFLQAKFELAHELTQKALRLNRDYIPAQMLAAEVLKRQGSTAAAEKIYDAILLKKSNDKQALFGKTHILIEKKLLVEALEVCLLLREDYPNDPYVKLLHAAIIALDGEHKKSKVLLRDIQQQLLSLGSKKQKERDILLLSASVDLINDNLNQARMRFSEYLSFYGENTVARRHLAAIAFKLNDLESAQSHIDKALESSHHDVELYLLAIQIYQHQRNPQGHFKLISDAYKLFPSHAIVKAQYVNALIANNDIEQALSILESSEHIVDKTLLGYLQLQTNQLEKSLITAQALLNQYPKKVEILQLAGELSLQLGQENDAEMFFQQALLLAPEFKPGLLALAGVAMNRGDNLKVEQYYQKILTYLPTDGLVLQLYADLAIKTEKIALAIKLLSAIKQEVIEYWPAQRALLALYMQTNQNQAAFEVVKRLENKFSFDQEILLAKSKLQIKAKQVQVAKKSLKILFGLAYDNVIRLNTIVMLQLEVDDIIAVEATVERITKLAGKVTPYLAARLHLRNKEFTAASVIITEHLAHFAQYSKEDIAWRELAIDLLIKKRQFELAIDELVPLFKHRKQRRYLQLLAELYLETSNFGEILVLLTDWLAIEKGDAWAVGQLSEIAQKMGQKDIAINAMENYPYLEQHAVFLNNLANLYLDADASKSLQYAQLAHQLLPNVAAINDTLGWALVYNKEYKKGLSYLREATSRDSKNATYHYHLAFSLSKLGRIELARMTLEKAATLDANHALNATVNRILIEHGTSGN